MLMIENKGVAPQEAFTLLGMSTARHSDVEGIIGQFGSGSKHAINVLLRRGLNIRVYCGLDRLVFGTERDTVDGNPVTHVTVTVNNRKPKRLGWVLEFGAMDWTEVRMGLREFISNAIDRTLANEGDVQDVNIGMTETVKARSGYTRVFISESDDVRDFVLTLNNQFLHFEDRQHESIIAKSCPSPCRIYREGVFVCEVGNSLCDYNFKKGELEIDESRNASEYIVRAAICRLYRRANRDDIARVVRSIADGESNTVEANLDPYYLTGYGTPSEQVDEWKAAWKEVAGDAVLCHTSTRESLKTFATRKGYDTVSISSQAWHDALRHYDVPSIGDILDSSEKAGRVVTKAGPVAEKAVATVWGWLEDAQMTKGKEMPQVAGFYEVMDAESECLGYYVQGGDTVYLRNDQGGESLLQTALEEVTHYVTGSLDASRDIQDFAFRLVTRWLA